MKRLNYNPFGAPPEPKESTVVDMARERPTTVDRDAGERVTPITIALPGYGGIRVLSGETPTEAMLQVLDFLVKHHPQVDAYLVDYAVLLARFPETPARGFCFRRASDQWTLCVPAATTREHALLQIIQALLEIARGPLRKQMHDAGITPYRE